MMDGAQAPARRNSPQQFQRETNLALVLRALRDRGEASRSELAGWIGIDRSTMTSIAGELLATGLVTETEGVAAGSRGGRRPRMLALDAGRVVAAGMELADQTAEWTICSLTGDVLAGGVIVRAGEADAGVWAQSALGRIRTELSAWTSRHPRAPFIAGVGLGVPGVVDPVDRRIRESIVLDARDIELGRLWETGGPAPTLLVDNDANCCAWNMADDEPDLPTTIFVQLNLHRTAAGTLRRSLAGVGLSFVMDGRVYYGSSHAAGELRGYRWTTSDPDQLGVPPGQATFEEITRELLRNLGVIASALDPGRIVLGGDLAGQHDLVARELTGALADTSVAPLFASGVLRAAGAQEYPVCRGAARMVLHELFTLPAVESGTDPRLSWPSVLERLRAAAPEPVSQT